MRKQRSGEERILFISCLIFCNAAFVCHWQDDDGGGSWDSVMEMLLFWNWSPNRPLKVLDYLIWKSMVSFLKTEDNSVRGRARLEVWVVWGQRPAGDWGPRGRGLFLPWAFGQALAAGKGLSKLLLEGARCGTCVRAGGQGEPLDQSWDLRQTCLQISSRAGPCPGVTLSFAVLLQEAWHAPSTPVLVSAGTELTFFLVAGTVLCFGCSVRMMLITLRCFSCC